MILYKAGVFILSFLSYLSVHSLRTAYSSSKSDLKRELEVDNFELGIVDSIMLIALGIGHFMHTIYPLKKPMRSLWIALGICAINYAMIPLMIILNLKYYSLLIGLMAINGFIQSYTWPHLLMLVHSEFDSNKNSISLGLWASNVNFGNITGFLICQEFVKTMGLSWQWGMFIASILTMLNSILMCSFIKEIKIVGIKNQEILEINQSTLISFQDQPNQMSVKQVFKDPFIIFLTISFSLIKSIIYGIMLWLPMYLSENGYADYKNYVSITYDGSSILGSICLGLLFKKINKKGMLLSPLIFVLIVIFLLIKLFDLGVVGYFTLIAGIGLCLGASFNTIAGLVTISLSKAAPKQQRGNSIAFYSAFLMAIANLVTAFTQLLIGFVALSDEHAIFLIFTVYSAAAFLSLTIVTIIEFRPIGRE